MNFLLVTVLAFIAIAVVYFSQIAGLPTEALSAAAASFASAFAALSAWGALGVLRNQRAWLGVSMKPRTGVTQDAKGNLILRLIPVIKNSGTLPATNVSCQARSRVTLKDPSSQPFPDKWRQLVTDAVIAPNSEIDLHYIINENGNFPLGRELDFQIEIRVRYQSSKSTATLIQQFSIWRISAGGGLPALTSNRLPEKAGEVYVKHGPGRLIEGHRNTIHKIREAIRRR